MATFHFDIIQEMKPFFIIILTLAHTAIFAQTDFQQKKQVLEQLVNQYVKGPDTVYLKYGSNEFLKAFLLENTLAEGEDVSFHDLRRCLQEEAILSILREDSVEYLLKQLLVSHEEIIYTLNIDTLAIALAPVRKVESNLASGVPLDSGIDYLILSEPVLTRDDEYMLVGLARGASGSMSGGIKLFQKKGDGYSLICDLNPWVE